MTTPPNSGARVHGPCCFFENVAPVDACLSVVHAELGVLPTLLAKYCAQQQFAPGSTPRTNSRRKPRDVHHLPTSLRWPLMPHVVPMNPFSIHLFCFAPFLFCSPFLFPFCFPPSSPFFKGASNGEGGERGVEGSLEGGRGLMGNGRRKERRGRGICKQI